MTGTVEELCREVYAETRAFYSENEERLGNAAYGFRILYGPPVMYAPVLFIGHQPGGMAESLRSDEHESWPADCVYAAAPWKLAARLRDVWGESLVKRCTGLNAIFVRAPTAKAWSRLSFEFRREVEAFSLARAERLVKALRPQRIVVIGLGTFDKLIPGSIELRGDRERTLVKRGELWGTPAFGVIHLSGAWVSHNDISKLADYFVGQASN